jgi:phenylpropionate dioxygenase-like ring-hydroxylating dioxygenase large terminal subunit
MFVNFWYVADESARVTDQPVGVRMLGHDFVLFRDASGKAHCLSDVCIHRGASLSRGRLRGDCVECPYHGWQYSGDGRCRLVPSLDEGTKIPTRARVDSYPVREQWGLIFAFLGDLPEAERPPIMDIREWDVEGWRGQFQRFEFALDYKRSMENGVDSAHNEFVHAFQMQKKKEGVAFPVPAKDLEVSEDGWEVGVRQVMPGANTGLRGQAGKKTPGPTNVYTGFHGVSSLRTYIHPTEWIKLHQYLYETPIDEKHTRLFFYNFRSYLTGPEHDAQSLVENRHVVLEDQVVLEPLRPVLTPQTTTRELLMPSDKPVVAYRERIKELEARGWRIDVDRVNRERDRVAYAIPSPARRESRNWVMDPVPLVPARAADSKARRSNPLSAARSRQR